MKHSILLLDDEVDNVDALERLFRRKYKVFKATSGDQGLAILDQESVAVIISDQRMPEMTGVEFFKASRKTQPDAIRILLTGYTDLDSVVGAINSGEVYRYVTKPWDPIDLSNTVEKAVEKYELRAELVEKNRRLEEALTELKTLDEAKNHFMVLINHELKTPLTVLMSFLDLLRETSLTEEQAKYIDRITGSSAKLKKIVDDVLELVSAETGIKKINVKKVQPASIFGDVAKNFQTSAISKQQEILWDSEPLKVSTDPETFRAILDRLVENAIKFGEKGSPVELRSTVEADQVRVSVVNQGKPLSQKVVQKILKPFALDEDIMNHSQGLGLGLSLCQALLKQQGSSLDFSSQGKEVRVSFALPKAK